jgi:hypothetical protein
MDASVLRGRGAAAVCHECGYPRRGLAESSVCPECGAAPQRSRAATRGLPTLNITQHGQIRLVWLGLLLLMYATFYSIQLAVVMNYEQLSLHAINLPTPKVAAVTLVQREIGGRPGPWGTMGWTCVLFQLVAVYLITVPTIRSTANEAWLSLRRVTRWTALVCTAALMGFMLSHGQVHIPLLSWYTWDLLIYALVIGELPANLFLYLYLARIADNYRMPRVARTMRALAWIGVGVRVLCVAIILYPFPTEVLRDQTQSLVLATIACFAIPAAVVGWAAVLNLMLRSTRIGFARPARRAIALLRDRAPVIRSGMRFVETHALRLCVVAGLGLWLLAIADQFEMAVNSSRRGLGGEIPMMNYAGPKISATWLGQSDYYSWRYAYSQTVDVAWILIVVFLITSPLPGLTPGDQWLRACVRWGLLIMIGMRYGLLLIVGDNQTRDSHVFAAHVLLLEAPATAAMMWYLARVARAQLLPRVEKRLRQLAVVSAVMISTPLVLHVLSKHTWAYHESWQIGVVGAAYAIASMGLGVMGVKWIVELGWTIARPLWAESGTRVRRDAPVMREIKTETPTGEPVGAS